MKISFIFGKGIDGCGVTRGAVIFEKWARENGHTTMVVDFDNGQTFGRSSTISWVGPVRRVEQKSSKQDVAKVVSEVNDCDIAIFHSHPTRKQGTFADRYRMFVASITKPIVVMHDHSIAKTNINAIPQACELFGMADVVVAQSLIGYSNEAYTAFDPGLVGRLIENPIWIDTKKYDQYRKTADERQKHLLYLGRMSPLKDPAMICRIAPLMPKDWDLSIIGCENSISSVSLYSDDLTINPSPYVPAFRPFIRQHTLGKDGKYIVSEKEMEKKFRMKSYDKYNYDFGMTNLGTCFASWCGYKLADEREYGHRMEYTMIESFLLTLPVIGRDFAEKAFSPEKKTWGSYGCALVSEARSEKELASELLRIWNNKKEWTERTEACRGLIVRFNEANDLAAKYFADILRMGKRKNKVDGLARISEYFPSAKARREAGEVIMSSANGFLRRTPMVMIDNKQIEIDGAAPVEPGGSLEDFLS